MGTGGPGLFAAGACHVLAFVCRSAHADRSVGIEAVRFEGEQRVFHTHATWDGWAFDHSGWNPLRELLAVNAAFEGIRWNVSGSPGLG